MAENVSGLEDDDLGVDRQPVCRLRLKCGLRNDSQFHRMTHGVQQEAILPGDGRRRHAADEVPVLSIG